MTQKRSLDHGGQSMNALSRLVRILLMALRGFFASAWQEDAFDTAKLFLSHSHESLNIKMLSLWRSQKPIEPDG